MMKNNLRILHVAETVRGGIATYLNEIHPLQTAECGPENVAYVVPARHRGDLDRIPDAAITAFPGHGRGPTNLMAMAAATVRAVLRHRPDVVHLHSTFAGAVLRPLLALLPGRPAIVYCPHGWAFSREVSGPNRSATRLAEGALARLADQVVCISEAEQAAARAGGIPDGKLALVRNGLAAGRRAPAPERGGDRHDGRLQVLFVGRFDRQKGHDLLIEAASGLGDAVSVRFVGASVVGRQGLGALPPNVEICGWMPRARIEAEYDRADIVAMPSRWEGFGLVALEAMRARRPVVAFRTGALGEIVVDGVTGILCETADAAGLAEGLRRARAADLPAMGARAADRFRDHFAVERTHRGLLKAYAVALARRRPGHRTLVMATSRQK